jgi:hypothetical protein
MDPGAPRVLWWYCADADLAKTGFPGCEAVAEALRIEMGASLSIVEKDPPVPENPRAVAVEARALFIAWVAPGGDGAAYVLYAYDALNDQVLSKRVELGKGKPPDAEAVAFLYRNMLGTSLYADLESIGSDSDLWSLAFPEEKVSVVKKVEGLTPPAPPARPPVVHLGLGYGLLAYPLGPSVWHALAVGIGVRVHRLVDLGIDVGVTPISVDRNDLDSGTSVSVHLVSLRAGLRVVALSTGPFSLLPGLGAGALVSIASSSNGLIDGKSRQTDPIGTLFASLLARLYFHRYVGLDLELGAELLVNPYRYEVGDPPKALKMGRLGLIGRLGFVFAI